MPPRLLTLLAIALPLAACLPTTSEPVMPDPATARNTRTVPYRKTPHPQRGYIITLRLDGAPGPFASVNAYAQYQISNPVCLPPLNPFTGAQHTSNTASRTLTVTQVSESVYTATAYLDGMEDADYFNEGVCQWELLLVGFDLKATGASGETIFTPMLWQQSIPDQQSRTLYFWKERYPRENGFEDFIASGQVDFTKIPEDKRNEFFSMTISSKEEIR